MFILTPFILNSEKISNCPIYFDPLFIRHLRVFTNVLVKKTSNIILDKAYNKKLRNINLKKRTMKKLLLDSCIKTTFSFDNVLYEQCDGISLGLSLLPVLANSILTELVNVIVKLLIETCVLKFY